jgi:predicted glutamine amidotransferase
MCGLVGIVGNILEKEKRMFDCMLMLDTIRGPHSTGVARVFDNNQVQVLKEKGTPWDLINDDPRSYYNVSANASIPRVVSGGFKVLMGHNRWATVGEITAENAHPFECGPIVGAHNGTLYDMSRKKLYLNEVVGTDSQAIYENMAYNGIDDTFSKLDGAWALTWYDKDEKSFNIVRNKERPLTYAFNKKGDVMFYASEEWMIFQAAERCGVELEDDDTYYSVPVDKHMKWDLTVGSTFSDEKVSITDRKGYVFKYKAPAPTKSNVLPFQKAPTGPAVISGQDSAAYWGGKKGSFVEFVVEDWRLDDQKKKYIQAFSVNKCTEVRIYPSVDPIEAILGDKEIETFTAKVKKVKYIPSKGGQCYITLDTATIEAVVPDVDNNLTEYQKVFSALLEDPLDDEIPFRGVYWGPRTVSLTREQWEEHTKNGCAWCAGSAVVENSQEYHWMSENEYLCEECITNEEVKQYVPDLRNKIAN